MRRKVILVSVLVASLAGLGAAEGFAAPGEEVKWKAALIPCDPVGEDDAGGEAEFESDRGLKVEIWGATLLRGETLTIEVDGQRVGTLTLGEDGEGEAVFAIHGTIDYADVDDDEPTTVFASERERC